MKSKYRLPALINQRSQLRGAQVQPANTTKLRATKQCFVARRQQIIANRCCAPRNGDRCKARTDTPFLITTTTCYDTNMKLKYRLPALINQRSQLRGAQAQPANTTKLRATKHCIVAHRHQIIANRCCAPRNGDRCKAITDMPYFHCKNNLL
jgi:hypothetical protein